MSKLIAFTGKLGSGKDTAAERFTALTTLPAVRLSFARKLKESAAACFGINPADWEWMKNDPTVVVELSRYDEEEQRIYAELTAREFLQAYGTEAHRDVFGDDFWVKQGLVEYDSYVGPEAVFFVTDCRFENEAKAVKDRGGTIVNIHGPNQATGGHVSEAGLPESYIDFHIRNTEREDNFAKLDEGLRSLAEVIKVPVIAWV